MTESVHFEPIPRHAGLSLRDFKREYLYPQKPVVITDAMQGWKALNAWTFDYLKSVCGDTIIQAFRYEDGNYRPDRIERIPLGEFIDNCQTRDWETYPFYVRDFSGLFLDRPDLLADFSIPGYFFNWFKFLPSFLRRPGPRIFIGPKGATTNLHQDIWSTHAWLGQLQGRKKWVLFSPDQKDFLYKNCWAVRPDNPDLARFPRFAEARGVETTLGPGEIIFVPGNWVHWVTSLDPTLSITDNFMGPGNFGPCLAGTFHDFVLPRVRRVLPKRLATARS